jgi:Asp/Glu/hydantoin racemase
MKRVQGGRNFYGVALGIILLETRFPRIPGDVGNASTFSFPVRYTVMRGVTVGRILHGEDPQVADELIRAARELEAEGVRAITTSGGYLALYQSVLARSIRVPVFTSSLLQVPMVHRMLGENSRIGILTTNSEALTDQHLKAAGVDEAIPIAIEGLQGGEEYSRVIVTNSDSVDVEKAEKDVLNSARTLLSKHPDVEAIVVEGANFAPYSRVVQDSTGLPVFDLVTLCNYVYYSTVQRGYHGFM